MAALNGRARSLAAMLRQSIELGTDVGDALRAFSDDMRDRRLLRAEERANQLPVKIVGCWACSYFSSYSRHAIPG